MAGGVHVSFPVIELPSRAMVSLITNTIIHQGITAPPPAPPPETPTIPPKSLYTSSLKKKRLLAFSQALETKSQKRNPPDAITASSLPTLTDETPQPSILELSTAASDLSDHICDVLVTDAENKLLVRTFQRRYDDYIDMVNGMRGMLSTMEKKGLNEKSFEGTPVGRRYRGGVKVAKALDGQSVVWEKGEEQYEQLASAMMRDFELIREVVEGKVGELVVLGDEWESGMGGAEEVFSGLMGLK